MARQQAVKQSGKVERLEARVTRKQKQILERAARLRGTSLTDFVVLSAQQAATAAIRESAVLSLDRESSAAFVKALLHPPGPNRAARVAARRYKRSLAR